jgi:hypothetical protein
LLVQGLPSLLPPLHTLLVYRGQSLVERQLSPLNRHFMVIGQSASRSQLLWAGLLLFEQVPPLVAMGQSPFAWQVTLLLVEQVPIGLLQGLLVLHGTLVPYLQ